MSMKCFSIQKNSRQSIKTIGNFIICYVTILVYLKILMHNIVAHTSDLFPRRCGMGGYEFRSLSLSGSLIDQNFITINTLAGKGCQRTVCHQIDISTKQRL